MISFKSLKETKNNLGTCDSKKEDVTFTVD